MNNFIYSFSILIYFISFNIESILNSNVSKFSFVELTDNTMNVFSSLRNGPMTILVILIV